MTKKEFLTAVLSLEITDEMREFAESSIKKIDHDNAKAATRREEKREEKRAEDSVLKDAIVDYLHTLENKSSMTTEIGQAIGVSTSKAVALCRAMVDGKVLRVEDVIVPKRGARKLYTLVVE